MAERRIEIQMAATGAEAAADALTKTAEAAKGVADAGEKIGDASQTAGPKLDKLVGIERAQVFAQIATQIGTVATSVQELGQEFADADPQFSQSLQTLGDGLSTVGNMASYAAQGFAVAGPAGAAVGAAFAAASPLIGKLKDAFVDIVITNRYVEDSYANLAAMEESAAARHEESVKRREAAGLRDLLEAETEALQKLRDEYTYQGKEDAARAAMERAQRDKEDAAAIASGADPDTIKKSRIARDAADERTRLEADLQRKREISEKARDNWWTANDAVDAAERAGLDKSVIGARRREQEQAKGEMERSGRAFDEARRLAPYKRAQIDAEAQGREQEIDNRAAASRARVAERQNRTGPGERDVEITAPHGAGSSSSASPDRLTRAANGMAAATSGVISRLISHMEAESRKIAALEGQVKNLRRGR